ncbi:MAG: ABC transporter permease [Lachnospiraceae bacterium]|jgi:peptide/nickel transport system permease protein|nr:ABC transporter permease [Lachnospiraceae bacterium]
MDKKIIFNRMKHNPFFIIGVLVIIFLILVCFLSPLYIQFDPVKSNVTNKFQAPDFSQGLAGHLLGTDNMGRDVFTRLVVGGRISLTIAFVVVALQISIGLVLGLVSGYFGGFVDVLVMRLCEIVLSIPQLILAIAIMSVMGASMGNLIFVMVFGGWVHVCKVTRNNVQVLKNQEFVHASVVLGAKDPHIIFTQILPNVLTQIFIVGSQRFGEAILTEASLSFLNLGITAPNPAWGNMIAAGRTYMATYPWMVIAPGIALMLAVLSFNFLGDGLRDVLDPKRKV